VNIESIEVEKLVLDPSNVRKHDQKNLEAIKGSLLKYGQQKPIVVDKKNIVLAGNGTLEAARSLGWKSINIIRSELVGNDATGYSLADNRTTDLSVWDHEALGKTLQALYEDDYAITDIGFDICDFLLADESLDEKDSKEKEKKYILEIEFPDEQSMKDEFEVISKQGLIVRIK